MMKKIFKDMKKLRLLLIVLLGVIVLVALGFIIYFGYDHTKELNMTDSEKFKYEYEKLNNTEVDDGKNYPYVLIPSDNVMKYSNVNEILDIFNNKGDAVIYVGYPSCLYCRSAVEVLCDMASELKIDKIYYLEAEEQLEGQDKLLEIFGDEFIQVRDDKNYIYAPSVLFVVNGEVTSYNIGTVFSQRNPYGKLDKYQVDGLSEIYMHGINDVITSMTT